MTPFALPALPFSGAGDWSALARSRPPLARVFASAVLPLALLPPAMLYLAGTFRPGMFPASLAHEPWAAVAASFFAVELFTLLALGWLIRQVARSSGLPIDDHGAFLIAALAPMPLWLSSLGLVVPDLAFTVALAAWALGLSCRAVFRGIVGLGRVREPVTAVWIAQIAMGGALIPWVLLVAAVITA